jgi:type II secretory pathway predicted ATPase ExeA
MYEAYFGLRQRPFSLLPDPAFLYPSDCHRAAGALLEYAFAEAGGFTVITGDIGTGKTTLLRHFLGRLPSGTQAGFISNTHPGLGAMPRRVLAAFGVESPPADPLLVLARLEAFVKERRERGARALLIVDEAQNLTADNLEELRMLSNLNSDAQVLSMVLAGQPNLYETLRRPELEQLSQRVLAEYHLRPLLRAETHRYVRHRLEVAGAGERGIFEERALDAVFEQSGGVPRLVNILCDNALALSFVCGLPGVGEAQVLEIARDRRERSVLPLARRDAAQ